MPKKASSAKRSRRRKWDGLKLDVWCGEKRSDGFTGFGPRKSSGVDVVHDLYDTPWPFPDSCADVVLFSNTLEKVDPSRLMDVLDEVWRIVRPTGRVHIAAHYANSFLANRDPTHMSRGFNEDTPYYWDPTRRTDGGEWLYETYRPKPWQVTHVEFELGRYMNWSMRPLKRIDGGPARVRVPSPEK